MFGGQSCTFATRFQVLRLGLLLKISEIQRKNAQAIGSARQNESEFSREQAKKLRTQITDSKKNITDLKAKVRGGEHAVVAMVTANLVAMVTGALDSNLTRDVCVALPEC